MAFASAFDNWAFTLGSFAPKIAGKLGMNPNALKKFLWGKYYYVASEKKIVKNPPSSDSNVMFVKFVMDPLVTQYKKFFPDDVIGNTPEVRKAHILAKETFMKWMPVDKAIFSMVIEEIPSPLVGQKFKVDTLSPEYLNETEMYLPSKQAIKTCSTKSPLVIFVAKMQPFTARLYDATTRSSQKSDSD